MFFEGQVKYNFINGDITAFLRYRYYGEHRITQFAVFDSISFSNAQTFSNSDFDRIRGTLLFLQWPHDYEHRTFALFEIDRISSNQLDKLFTNKFVGTAKLNAQEWSTVEARAKKYSPSRA